MSAPAPEPAPRRGRARGRRRGSGDTKGAILEAARAVFGEHGFERGTIRAVAARAKVDPALVQHYFGSKEGLFVAAVELPIDPSIVVPTIVDGPPEHLGERFVAFWLDLLETPSVQPLMLGMIRSATTDPLAAAMLRDVLTQGPILAIARTLPAPDAPLRATLAGSQLIGLALLRYVVGVEPLASASREAVIAALAPTIQRYLVGDLEPRDG